MTEQIEKFSFTENDVVMLEAASNLNILSAFEKRIIDDMKQRFSIFGYKTKITEKQRCVLAILYKRYKKIL